MERLLSMIVRYNWLTVLLTIIVTCLLLSQVRHLQVIIDPNTFLPQKHPYVITTNVVEDLFGSKHTIVIGLIPRQGDILQQHVLEKIRRITNELSKTPRVIKENLLSLSARRAKSITGNTDGMNVQLLMAHVPETDGERMFLRQAIESNPVYLNTIVSDDFHTAAVLVEFRNGPDGYRGMINAVESIIKNERDETVDIILGGKPVFLSYLERYAERMAILLPIGLLIIGFIQYLAFRSIQGLFLPLLTAILAVAWGLGIMGATGISMDVFNSTTPILILAISAGHAVQVLKRYYEEYYRIVNSSQCTRREANTQAVVASLTKITPVMIAACGIAALGFYSLVVFELTSVRVFGILTGTGILSTLILELTFIPALRSLLPPPGDKERNAQVQRSFSHRSVSWIANWITGANKQTVVIAGGLIIAVAAAGIPKVVVESSTKSFFSQNLDFQQHDLILNNRLGGTNTVHFVFQGTRQEAIKDPRLLQTIVDAQKFLEEQPYVGKSLSIADFVKRMHQAVNNNKPGFYRIPESRDLISQYLLLYSMSGEPGDFDTYVDYDYRVADLVVYLKTDSTAEFLSLLGRFNAFMESRLPSGVTVNIGGSIPNSAALAEVIVRNKLLNIAQVATVVFVVASLVFRSVLAGVLVLMPVLLAVFVNFGLMGWSGIRLNIPNSLSSAMAVGIGADYAIYLLYRLREELQSGCSLDVAIRQTLLTAGKACFFVALAVAGGYSVLWLSPGFYVHMWLATLIVSAMLVSALSALTLVPLAILTFKPRFVLGDRVGVPPLTPVRACLLFGALSTLLFSSHARAADLSPQKIMENNFVVTKVTDSVFNATFTLTNKGGQERTRKVYGVTKLEANPINTMRMTRFLEPGDVKGTVTLLIEQSDRDDDMWVFLPALKKVRRLVSNNKKESYIGTDFSYGDVIGYKLSEWEHKVAGEEKIDSSAVYVIESTPRSEAVRSNSGYSKRKSWIRKDNFVSVRQEFWDENGDMIKIILANDIQHVDPDRNKWQPMILSAQSLQTGHSTRIVYDNYKVNQAVQDEYFSPRYMERER